MTQSSWIYGVGLAVALLFGGYVLQTTLGARYREMGDDITATRATLRELREQRQLSDELADEQRRLRDAFGEPLDEPGRQEHRTRFYSRIAELALDSGLAVVSVQPRPETVSEAGVVAFPVVVSLDGDMRGLISMLAQVRRTSALMEIERLVIRRRERAEVPLSVEATVVSYGYLDRETRERLARERE